MRLHEIHLTLAIFALLGSGCAGTQDRGQPAIAASVRTQEVTFLWRGEGQSVHVAGEFNGWNTAAAPLIRQPDGSWARTMSLAPGRYAYKFVIDGTVWKTDPNAKVSADDGHGGLNSVIEVGPGQSDTLVIAPAPSEPVVAPSRDGGPPRR
jgi:1,4-alpha-glucan branching enzyme